MTFQQIMEQTRLNYDKDMFIYECTGVKSDMLLRIEKYNSDV
jgi:hypothetical protein